MANKQINELTEKSNVVVGDDLVLVWDSEEAGSEKTKKMSYSNLSPYVKVSDVKSEGTNGGVFTSGAWRTRDFNTEDSDDNNICTLAANQITLAAGTYNCRIIVPAYSVNNNRAKLVNTTAVSDIILGVCCYTSVACVTFSHINGRFTIAADQALEVQHRCDSTQTPNGFGEAVNFGPEVFTVAEFWKVG
jgi:hypothetical protein